eukprot:167861-Chlamydomonas_euryale.AAC.2
MLSRSVWYGETYDPSMSSRVLLTRSVDEHRTRKPPFAPPHHLVRIEHVRIEPQVPTLAQDRPEMTSTRTDPHSVLPAVV